MDGEVQDPLYVVHTGKIANIADVYDSQFDFSGTYAMASMGYRSQSFLTVGMFKKIWADWCSATGQCEKCKKRLQINLFILQESLVEALAGMGAIINNTALHADWRDLWIRLSN